MKSPLSLPRLRLGLNEFTKVVFSRRQITLSNQGSAIKNLGVIGWLYIAVLRDASKVAARDQGTQDERERYQT